MTALTDNGVTEKDILTQYVKIQQLTKWDDDKPQEIAIGYRDTNIVTAKIKKIDKSAIIIDNITTAGGDLTRIDNINFSVDNPSAFYEEAKQKTIVDAQTKASQIANLSRANLGKPTYISENAHVPPPIYIGAMYERAISAAPKEKSISPSEMDISLTIQLTYAIAN